MITRLMRTLRIEYYEYQPYKKTLIIYEPIPVKTLLVIRKSICDVNIVIKS